MYVYAVSNVSIFLSLSLHCSLISEMMFELKFHRLLCKQDAVASIIVREQLLVTQIVDVYKHISNILEVVCLDSDVEIGTLSLEVAAEHPRGINNCLLRQIFIRVQLL